jgi:phage protein D
MPGIPNIPNPTATGGEGWYDALYNKYSGFDIPQVSVELNEAEFLKSHPSMAIRDISVELSCGFEASIARFRIYSSYDVEKAEFRYDELKKHVTLGAALKVSFGYQGKFTHVFTGFVASVDFCREGEGVPFIEVTGMDAKGVMMASSYAAQLTETSYGDAVKQVLSRTAYSTVKSSKIISEIKVDATPDKKASQQNGSKKANAETIEMVSESDYEFIVKAAKKFNYEFFIDRGKVIFRKARSETAPLATLSPGHGIINFRLGYSLTGMVESIEVRAMDPGAGKIISSKKKYKGKLSVASKAKSLISGSRRIYIDPTVFSKEQADARLDSLVTQMSYRLGNLECECIGIPELVPGRFSNINIGSPGDNCFYITNVIHEFGQVGTYHTRLIGSIDSLKA